MEAYSIYEINGLSGVNKPYEYDITFVSNAFIDIEKIVDTDIELVLSDNKNSSLVKLICQPYIILQIKKS